MASYFHGHGSTDIQAADGLQTLYLMNPGYTGFTDPINSSGSTNMVLLNSMSMNSINPMTLSHVSNNQQHFVGIPLQPSAQHDTSSSPPPHSQAQVQYNLWAPSQHATLPTQQGLSLTLASREMSVPAVMPAQHGPASSSSSGMHGFLMGSKYLKATQQLLDEVVSVGNGGLSCNNGKGGGKKENKEEMEADGHEEETVEGKKKKTVAAELSTAERQEFQMKKAKLVNMLDEVEQRYRHYHHQMQVVVASFESIAGPGSAKSYTSLALQTISKQFRCLRDAITFQIRSTSKSLGEEETKTGGSRLRFIDHHLRQQRALQQLGMIQHNAWRPQRGLPERSVSILRAWLFEHFLHPYPKDSDKIMLAKQTGLTRSQVSNWFINARVRLWKPMVEEMYKEEIKDQEQNTGTGENSSKSDTDKDLNANSVTQSGRKTEPQRNQSATQTNPLDQIGSAPMLTQTDSFYTSDEELMQPKLKKTRNDQPYGPNRISNSNSIHIETQHEEVNNRELLMKFMEGNARVGFGPNGSYGIDQEPIGRFDSDHFTPRYGSNGVSLTLGLPHCETMPMSGAQTSFLTNEGMRVQIGAEANEYCGLGSNGGPGPSIGQHASNAYEMDMQTRKSFAAQLMRNFVA
ncbi:hypothetical protein LUZ60_007472 [Juncus effusus]|nr:hypothetical protein LUZ60_007472 [Juncus effusus]